jgi:hypothetical protein
MTITHEVFVELINQIANESRLKLANLYTLSRMEQDCLNSFKEIWPTIPTPRRREVMRSLVEICESNFEVDFRQLFRFCLNDPDPEVRATAINGLWEDENPILVERFANLLRTDEAVIVRAAAAIALGRFVYLGEVEELDLVPANLAKQTLLESIYQADEHIDVRRRSVESVAYSSDEQITRIIENAYYDEAEEMQTSAVFAMGRNVDSCWIPHVLTELDNPSPAIRFEAARSCGELEISKAVPKLVELFDQEDDLEVQEMIIWSLGHIGGTAARQILEACLEHNIELLATAAQDALDELNVFGDTSLSLFDFEDDDDWLDDSDDIDLDDDSGDYDGFDNYEDDSGDIDDYDDEFKNDDWYEEI